MSAKSEDYGAVKERGLETTNESGLTTDKTSRADSASGAEASGAQEGAARIESKNLRLEASGANLNSGKDGTTASGAAASGAVAELERGSGRKLKKLFSNSSDTLIDSCLQGYGGRVFVKGGSASAAVSGGEFAFFGGVADGELIDVVLKNCPKAKIFVPMSEEWGRLIEICGATAEKKVRYATKRGARFDRQALTALAVPPQGFKIRQIDRELYEQLDSEEWSRDFMANFDCFDSFERSGLGFVAIYNGVVAAGASSYSACDGAIDVQITTRDDFRRRGLARACAAKLILACLERGLYPNWDAEHATSLHIAEQLGYEFLREYTAYLIRR